MPEKYYSDLVCVLFYKNRQTPVFLLVYLFLWWPFVGALRSMPPTLSEKKEPFLSIFGMTRQVTPLTFPWTIRDGAGSNSHGDVIWIYKIKNSTTKTLEIESNIKRFIYSISVWLSNNRESTLCPRRRFTVRFWTDHFIQDWKRNAVVLLEIRWCEGV